MGLNRLLLHSTVSAVAVLLLADGAQAQVGAQTAPEEIVVTGIRASLQQSVATKRSANAIVDAITAEDIGKFPDKNVAESLSHVPASPSIATSVRASVCRSAGPIRR